MHKPYNIANRERNAYIWFNTIWNKHNDMVMNMIRYNNMVNDNSLLVKWYRYLICAFIIGVFTGEEE